MVKSCDFNISQKGSPSFNQTLKNAVIEETQKIWNTSCTVKKFKFA